ncbi:efflux RND transporter periplasmic adaptor subunit [Pedobacter glucosidilyticus]|uniref:efflux RND transporter periplasmic adaptor subunit n=1 Tax=Pedobacter glucosidilyticus TaxID=1122941 RepID=UPI00047EF75D|nr:efflux RND transporter periplasmic adaptor subunit [Pedobacter glucosidilyticus]
MVNLRYKKSVFVLMLSLIAVISSCELFTDKKAHEHTTQYTCPMHPEIIRDEFGSCPICKMDLVPKITEAEQVKDVSLESLLQPTNSLVVSKIGLTKISESEEEIAIDALGFTAYNDNYTGTVSARFGGRIEKMYLKYNFQDVSKGQKVLELYSPEMLTAQEELLFLVKNDAENIVLIQAAKQKLQLLGVSAQQINQIIKTKESNFTLPVYSSYTGHIHDVNEEEQAMQLNMNTTQLQLREGMYVNKGDILFKVYNPEHLWVLVDVYTHQQKMVKVGSPVSLTVETHPDKPIQARINFIEPFFREGAKTIKARINIDNPNQHLPVGAQVKATIKAETLSGNWLPESAVISLGLHEVVMLKTAAGFKVHQVKTGYKVNAKVQILKGLTAKDEVAVNAQYLIDSESFIAIKP